MVVTGTSSVSLASRGDGNGSTTHRQGISDLGWIEGDKPHLHSSGLSCSTVQIAPIDCVKRLGIGHSRWFMENIQAPAGRKLEICFHGRVHLLAMYHEGARREGETRIDGLTPSQIRNLKKKLTFVPAGYGYREEFDTSACTWLTFLYLDPSTLEDGTAAETDCPPRIHFDNAVVWETAAKLRNVIEEGPSKEVPYLLALSNVLAFELSRCNSGPVRNAVFTRGGLAGWQKRAVASYIEENLSKQICLGSLAERARLSRHHFCRAFRQSFGVPPHRYHVERRIDQAKLLLADRAMSITDVGLTLGYSQTSSFSVAFRKLTGRSPSEYRREFE